MRISAKADYAIRAVVEPIRAVVEPAACNGRRPVKAERIATAQVAITIRAGA
jgi:hypothetical protein